MPIHFGNLPFLKMKMAECLSGILLFFGLLCRFAKKY